MAYATTLTDPFKLVNFFLGTGRYFRNISVKNGLEFTFVDMREPEKVKTALKETTKMVFIETPSNPLMRLVDIAEVSTGA